MNGRVIMMNLLRPLSPYLPRMQQFLYSVLIILKRWSIPLLLLATILLFFYFLCLKIGLLEYCEYIVKRVGFLLSSRSISFFFRYIVLELPPFLSFTLGFIQLFPPIINMMFPEGGEGGGEGEAGPANQTPEEVQFQEKSTLVFNNFKSLFYEEKDI